MMFAAGSVVSFQLCCGSRDFKTFAASPSGDCLLNSKSGGQVFSTEVSACSSPVFGIFNASTEMSAVKQWTDSILGHVIFGLKRARGIAQVFERQL